LGRNVSVNRAMRIRDPKPSVIAPQRSSFRATRTESFLDWSLDSEPLGFVSDGERCRR